MTDDKFVLPGLAGEGRDVSSATMASWDKTTESETGRNPAQENWRERERSWETLTIGLTVQPTFGWPVKWVYAGCARRLAKVLELYEIYSNLFQESKSSPGKRWPQLFAAFAPGSSVATFTIASLSPESKGDLSKTVSWVPEVAHCARCPCSCLSEPWMLKWIRWIRWIRREPLCEFLVPLPAFWNEARQKSRGSNPSCHSQLWLERNLCGCNMAGFFSGDQCSRCCGKETSGSDAEACASRLTK